MIRNNRKHASDQDKKVFHEDEIICCMYFFYECKYYAKTVRFCEYNMIDLFFRTLHVIIKITSNIYQFLKLLLLNVITFIHNSKK